MGYYTLFTFILSVLTLIRILDVCGCVFGCGCEISVSCVHYIKCLCVVCDCVYSINLSGCLLSFNSYNM